VLQKVDVLHLRPAYAVAAQNLLKAELYFNRHRTPSLIGRMDTLLELVRLSADGEGWMEQYRIAAATLELLRHRHLPVGLDWLQKIDAWLDSMTDEEAPESEQSEMVALRRKLLEETRQSLLSERYASVRDAVLEATASLSSPVLKEDIVLLIFGLRAASRVEPPDPEVGRILTHRYWDAKEAFIEQLGVDAEQAEHLSIRMLDIFDEPQDTRRIRAYSSTTSAGS
jgi:hypothetical protein